MSFLGFVPFAHANIMIEPIVGGQFSSEVTASLKKAAPDTGSFSSLIYGGRLGFDFSGFLIGAEYLGADNVSVKFDGPNGWGSLATNATMSNKNYGGFIGIEMMQPFAVRLIGTFFAVSDASIIHNDTNGKPDSDFNLHGYGYKGELSTRIARFLTLGVSYYQIIYTDVRDNMAGTTSDLSPVGAQHSVMTHISIPLEF